MADNLADRIERHALSKPELDPDELALISAGQRLADAHNEALRAGAVGWWIAARLTDGGTDGKVYQARSHAIKHQLHETQCAYVQVQPMDMTGSEGKTFLHVNRKAYDAGFRLTDPDDDRHILPVRSPQ